MTPLFDREERRGMVVAALIVLASSILALC